MVKTSKSAQPFSMNDLLSQRNNLKKMKKKKKIVDDGGFIISSNIKNANSNVIIPSLQDIISSMKSLKSTGIKLN